MQFDAGWHTRAQHVRSPNCDDRPPAVAVELLVLHGITVPAGEMSGTGIEQLFTNTCDLPELIALRVSAHFVIRRAGELVQFVSCAQRAWHAGTSAWRGRSACNDFSIGIELEGCDDIAYTDEQYDQLAALVANLQEAYPSLVAIAGHCDIASTRKTDPGPSFDWQRLFTLVGPELNRRK